MSQPFDLGAFETALRGIAARGNLALVQPFVNGSGHVVLDLAERRGDETVDRLRFLVRGHSAVEMSLQDMRGRRPAKKAVTLPKAGQE